VGDQWGQEDVDWFWRTIDSAGQGRERLRELLMSFSKEEVYRFQDIFLEMAAELRDEPYTFYVSPGESEDGVEDISNCVVSSGRSTYEAVISEPSRMPAEVAVDDPTNLHSVAYEVYFKRFGEPLDLM
jgi:hypothetical protein